MKSLSRVGLGLTVVFGCLFLALLCEIYYLLWWKRRVTGRTIMQDDGYTNTRGDFFYLSCLKKMKKRKTNKTAPSSSLMSKPFDENGVEIGLMLGPPRFLFTITEETREDLESENGKSREESRKLSDLMRNGDSHTPYLTPVSSPAFFTPPLTPLMGSSHSKSSSNGYNPLYESSTDVEFSKMISSSSSSPPPLFKFLRDAEEKLQRKNITIATSKKNIV